MNILYIGKKVVEIKGGADQVNKRNIDALECLYMDVKLDCISPIDKRFLLKKCWGGDSNFLKYLESKIEYSKYDYVFLSQSLYGYVAQFIKARFPYLTIICFFHNIEVQYAKEFIRTSGILHYPFYFSVKSAEKKAVMYSDYYIVLNNRDACLLKKIYGKNSNLILPVSLEDTFQYEKVIKTNIKDPSEIIYLFVGTAFFANVEAVRWFIKNVLVFVPGRLYIVGKGMDFYAREWESDRVKVWGFVKDLSEFYYKAAFVVSPVFSGGGMKTKTAEALMFGKMILGTKEAFEGYDVDSKCMLECNNASDFIRAINSQNEISFYNQAARNLFLHKYTYNSSLNLLKTIII